jgi:hypothetical protein
MQLHTVDDLQILASNTAVQKANGNTDHITVYEMYYSNGMGSCIRVVFEEV